MNIKRFLIIIYEKNLIQFLLIGLNGSNIIKIAYKKSRIYRNVYNFSITEFILQYLTKWSIKLGFNLVKEMVPIVPQMEKDGVSEIFVFTYKDFKDLRAITKNVIVKQTEVTKEGIQNIMKFFKFENLLYVSINNNYCSLVRFRKAERGSIKVVTEKKELFLNKYIKSIYFKNELKRFEGAIDYLKAFNIALNFSYLPIFKIKTFECFLNEYILTNLVLSSFSKCYKLNLNTFGYGKMTENMLIIGGERLRITENIPLNLLSILTSLNIEGNFSVFVDNYGLFDILQTSKQQFLADFVYYKFITKLWGNAVVINGDKKVKLDDIAADVTVKAGSSERQIIPMSGRILNFKFSDKGDIYIKTKNKYAIQYKMHELQEKNLNGNFVIDARERPVKKAFNKLETSKELELIRNWMKGIDAL